jgi:hypothetical protein
MPRPPKDPKLRQRRNVEVTARTFIDTSPLVTGGPPPLPARNPDDDSGAEWHPKAVQAWQDIWGAPMATEYTQADVHRVEMYVDLIHRYWTKPSVSLAAEIRLQGVCLGVTPIDRRRLQWEICRVEGNETQPEPKPERPARLVDPRTLLRIN